jgi:hypothetical protein
VTSSTDVRRGLIEAEVHGFSDEMVSGASERLGSETFIGAARIIGVRINETRAWGHHFLFLTSASLLEMTAHNQMKMRRSWRRWLLADMASMSTQRRNRFLIQFIDGSSLRFGFTKFRKPNSKMILEQLERSGRARSDP